MKPAKFRYLRAESTDHATHLLRSADDDTRILAGGQSLIPALSARNVSVSCLIDIMRCPGLETVSRSREPGNIGERVTLGAACRQSHIERNPLVLKSVPLLAEALGWVAMPQVRSRGTVVGCLAQANAGGEVPVVALALDVHLHLISPQGMPYVTPAEEFFAREAGTTLPPRTMIVSATFRAQADGEGWGFSEIQLRQGHFALVCCAATLLLEEDQKVRAATIAIGGLTVNPYRAHKAEYALLGETLRIDSTLRDAAHIAAEERPWPARADVHATPEFRSHVAPTAVLRALQSARARALRQTGNVDGYA